MTPFIEEALKLLTSRCNLSGLHSNDEDLIKVTLRALKKQGEIIDPAAIEQWALSNNWQPKPLKDLISWASAVSSGGRVQLKFKAMAPTEKEITKIIKERVAENA